MFTQDVGPGEEEDDHYRNKKVLDILKDENNRSAYLISRFSLVNPDGNEIYKTVVKNEFTISTEEKGENGFGYDNILIPTSFAVWNSKNVSDERKWEISFNKETIGCMTQDEKNAINNRGRIAQKIKEYLSSVGGLDE